MEFCSLPAGGAVGRLNYYESEKLSVLGFSVVGEVVMLGHAVSGR